MDLHTYRNILLNTPYSDIINLCNTNKEIKKLCTKNFWKDKYIKDFGVYPNNNINPEEFYRNEYFNRGGVYKGAERYVDIKTLGIDAARMNDLDLVNYFLKKNPEAWNLYDMGEIMKGFAENNNIEIVNLLLNRYWEEIKKSKESYVLNLILEGLTKSRNVEYFDEIYRLKEKFDQAYNTKVPLIYNNDLLINAIKSGNVEMVNRVIEVYRLNPSYIFNNENSLDFYKTAIDKKNINMLNKLMTYINNKEILNEVLRYSKDVIG